jgi:hypothetical protein
MRKSGVADVGCGIGGGVDGRIAARCDALCRNQVSADFLFRLNWLAQIL